MLKHVDITKQALHVHPVPSARKTRTGGKNFIKAIYGDGAGKVRLKSGGKRCRDIKGPGSERTPART